MYSIHPVQTLSNGGIGNGIMDPTGTINPATLNPPGALVAPSQSVAQQPSRGLKRSRSPEHVHGDAQHGDDGGTSSCPCKATAACIACSIDAQDADDSKPRKRGRPPKATKVGFADTPNRASQPPTSSQATPAPPVQTPQLPHAPLPQSSPPLPSPAKSTPAKATVIKALPTVRDHTTDQLNQEGDEYIPRETDDAGETKVTATGHALDGREYRCRTFFVPNRGDKLFMLATECARVLGYRDSYLLFNKNRSLYKIIATQAEKDDLIHQEILPYSYRSRQIAIVTARSMFRQFGSRLIVNGRRVRDDYWESKARKQGFTEEDAAGEKRPGAAKAREAAAAEATQGTGTTAPQVAFAHTSSAYTGKLDHDYLGTGVNPMQPFGGLNPAPGTVPLTNNPEPFNQRTATDTQPRDYSNVQRPRHDMAGAPYQDLTRPTASGEILNQATQTVEINKQLEQQRKNRKEYLDNYWSRPHEPPVQPNRPSTAESDNVPQVSQAVQSPRVPASNAAVPAGQYGIMAQTPQRPSQTMPPQSYRQPPHAQNPMIQSPMAQQHTPLRPDQMHRRPPSMAMPQGMVPSGMGPAGILPSVAHGQPQGHGYAPPHMWSQGPPQPSPLSQQHNMQHGSMHGTPVQQYQTMGTMPESGYPAMGQNPYQPSPSPQQFMHHQTTGAQQPGMPGWAPGAQVPQQGWQNY
ncbi:hypothetical protein K504DRAFT_385358 [Pleomassaria siparia CBS 279.74]|uniref:Uncharacterized protein n=1 Tax=Pleomassaria siparia CBS 279.74 TaxID=1314801 RepID=A0A6G1K1Z9_9PLEO|nr:hypothetical protein K504DRAFT_385358 [Pleomassaria siparia CBS 279.74]